MEVSKQLLGYLGGMMGDHSEPRIVQRLGNDERLKELRPHNLLRDVAGIIKGMTCIDLGCGTGVFSFPMVLCVGSQGIVYSVDNSTEMLEHIRAKNPPPNLILIQCDASETELDSNTADFCLLAFILHHVKQPDKFITEAFRLLKPEGKVLVVEWKEELDSPGPSRDRRITREHIGQLFKQAGFIGFEYTEWSNNHYVATSIKCKPE